MVEAGPVTVLIDDVRSFRDDRPCHVARSSAAGVLAITGITGRIDDLWLDHDLAGDDTIWPVIRVLEDAASAGRPFDIGLIHIHASRAQAAHEMRVALRRSGYVTERSVSRGLWRH